MSDCSSKKKKKDSEWFDGILWPLILRCFCLAHFLCQLWESLSIFVSICQKNFFPEMKKKSIYFCKYELLINKKV